METLTTIAMAVGLAMDAFAVSLGIGAAGQANEFPCKFRLAFHFGFFQGMMAALGWLTGSTIANLIAGFDHWIALVLLVYVGGKMIISGLNPTHPLINRLDPLRGKTLLMLSIATSIDATAVGLSMALLGDHIVGPALIIGAVSFLLSGVGLYTGDRLGQAFGKRMEILGGLILIGIGLRIVITHLSASVG